jgi:hypothetical protein
MSGIPEPPDPDLSAPDERDYLVRWEIEVSASSPEDAARTALEIQHNPCSVATLFFVADEADGWIRVDLEEIDQENDEE